MNTETMKPYAVKITLEITVLARDVNKAENLVMDFVDGPIFTALLKRKKVTGVTYTMSPDNPKATEVDAPAIDTPQRKVVLTIGELGNSWAGRPPNVTLHESQQAAEAALLEYVRRNWESEMGCDPPATEDQSDMVSQYFETVPERYEIAVAQ